ILDNPYIEIEPEEKRILMVRWYFFYSLYKRKISEITQNNIEEINNIVLDGEKYLLYDNEKMNYYFKVSQSSLDKTNYKLIYLKKSIDIALKINDTLHCIYNYSGLGYLYMIEKDYEKANDFFVKAIQLCEETDNRFELGMLYKNLGELFISKRNYEKALEYLHLSVNYKKEFHSCLVIDNFANIIIPYSYLVFCYIKTGKFDIAKEYMEKVNNILPNIGMFTNEIPIFIEYLKSMLKFKESNDTTCQKQLKTIIDRLIKLTPKPIFINWLEEIT
ncbi:MAG TPA: tetratricopeptide repeat protein, partial [Spirochaetota bacterium]|nr:tetratricopeptide repeat protein [Spirochaetota bacterium]